MMSQIKEFEGMLASEANKRKQREEKAEKVEDNDASELELLQARAQITAMELKLLDFENMKNDSEIKKDAQSEFQMFKDKNEELEEKLEAETDQVARLMQQVEELKAASAEILANNEKKSEAEEKSKADDIAAKMAELTLTISTLEASNTTLKLQSKEAQNKYDLLETKYEIDLAFQRKDKEREVDVIQKSLADKVSELHELKKQLDSIESDNHKLKGDLKMYQAAGGVVDSSKSGAPATAIDQSKLLTLSQERVDTLEKELKEKSMILSEKEIREETLSKELAIFQKENKANRDALNEKSAVLNEQESILNEKKSELDNLQKELAFSKTRITELEGSLVDVSKTVATLESQVLEKNTALQISQEAKEMLENQCEELGEKSMVSGEMKIEHDNAKKEIQELSKKLSEDVERHGNEIMTLKEKHAEEVLTVKNSSIEIEKELRKMLEHSQKAFEEIANSQIKQENEFVENVSHKTEMESLKKQLYEAQVTIESLQNEVNYVQETSVKINTELHKVADEENDHARDLEISKNEVVKLKAELGHMVSREAEQKEELRKLHQYNSRLKQEAHRLMKNSEEGSVSMKKSEKKSKDYNDAYNTEDSDRSFIRSPSSKHRPMNSKLIESNRKKTREDHVVAIQATIRGMLTRQELWKAAKSRAALDSGVLVAVTGTSQGQTGWYMGQSREYFYFCLEENDFVLLTGPVKERDFQKLVDRSKEYHVVKEMVHRTALVAIRDQLKTFAEKHLQNEKRIVELQSFIEHLKEKYERGQELLVRDFDREKQQFKASMQQLMKEKDLRENQLQDLMESNRKLERQMKSNSSHSNRNKTFDGDLITSLTNPKLIKLQALTRGFTVRKKLEKEKKLIAARRSGVMYALDKTKQGETGWYANPAGEIYYFNSTGAEWQIVAGPLSEKQYNNLISHRYNTLTKCHFGVSMEVDPSNLLVTHGTLHISGETKKLYMVYPAEEIMYNPRYRRNSILKSPNSSRKGSRRDVMFI
jgi:chromosome segregation ATPase